MSGRDEGGAAGMAGPPSRAPAAGMPPPLRGVPGVDPGMLVVSAQGPQGRRRPEQPQLPVLDTSQRGMGSRNGGASDSPATAPRRAAERAPAGGGGDGEGHGSPSVAATSVSGAAASSAVAGSDHEEEKGSAQGHSQVERLRAWPRGRARARPLHLIPRVGQRRCPWPTGWAGASL